MGTSLPVVFVRVWPAVCYICFVTEIPIISYCHYLQFVRLILLIIVLLYMYNKESTCNIPTTKKVGGRDEYWISSTVGGRGKSQRESHIHALHLRRVIERC